MSSGAVVANPGAVQMFVRGAARLAELQRLHRYVAPLAVRSGAVFPPYVRSLTRVISADTLARRAVPPQVPQEQIATAGTLAELGFVSLYRSPTPRRIDDAVMYRRNVLFARSLVKHLDGETSAFIGNAGTSLEPLRRARALGLPGIVVQPTANHWHAVKLLGEEAARMPHLQTTLQGHDAPRWHLDRLDAELDAASHVVALSQFQARTYVEAGVPADKLHVVNLGVDLELFGEQDRSGHEDSFKVLFVGQITQRKGLSYLIDGFLAADIPDSELILVGRPVGSPEQWLRHARVRHVPHMSRSQLPAIYAQSDVFVLPSLLEGFPQTALEAMATGLPPVLSDHTFVEDVVRDGVNGLVVPIRDSDAIATSLQRLWRDRELRVAMGQQAAATARGFTWSRFGDGLAELA